MKNETITKCPKCHDTRIVKNGRKGNGKQQYLCRNCGRQFISDNEKTYKGTLSIITTLILRMLVRGSGIRDISFVLQVSITKVLKTLRTSKYEIKAKKTHYDTLEVDEFWTYVGKKKNRLWLIYAYCRESGEIIAYMWGKRDLKTAKKLRRAIKKSGITYDEIAMDEWDSFKTAFNGDMKLVGKKHTKGIEGNNCTLRHRVRRGFRKSCCFSKKLFYHRKAFDMAFFYINFGFI
jgi:IS1 family transposase/transposase-like protein